MLLIIPDFNFYFNNLICPVIWERPRLLLRRAYADLIISLSLSLLSERHS
nr:MAG TPA: hypothetical protein [Caudoviricetes sp.]